MLFSLVFAVMIVMAEINGIPVEYFVQMDRITRPTSLTSLTSPTIPSSYTLLHLH
jgi:hypothetical protein